MTDGKINPALKAKERPELSRFTWNDPFLLEAQLSEEERMIRDSAAAFAADERRLGVGVQVVLQQGDALGRREVGVADVPEDVRVVDGRVAVGHFDRACACGS